MPLFVSSVWVFLYNDHYPNLQLISGQHQGQPLQGQAVFIQGQPSGSGQTPVVQGQAIMLQNQGNHQGQVQLITTTTSSGQQLQIVPHIQQKQGILHYVLMLVICEYKYLLHICIHLFFD